MDYLITAEPVNGLIQVIIWVYILGLLFCILLRDVINKSNLQNIGGKPVRYAVLFFIWVCSPAVIIGLLILTIRVFVNKPVSKDNE